MGLAKTNSYKIKYRFVYQTIDICKANADIALKIMIILNSNWHI